MENRYLIFKASVLSSAWKAANSRGRTWEDSPSSLRFMLVGRKRICRTRVIKLRELDLTQVLKEKKIRTVEPHMQNQIQKKIET